MQSDPLIGPETIAEFTYDGDGNRVKAVVEGTPNDTVIAYSGNYRPWDKDLEFAL